MKEVCEDVVGKAAYSFQKWLLALMGLRNLTRSSLVEDCSVEHSTVARWLDGSQKPTGKNIPLLAKSLRLSEVDLRAALAHENSRTSVVNQWDEHMSYVGDPSTWSELWEKTPPIEPTTHVFDALTQVGHQTLDPKLIQTLIASLDNQTTVFDMMDLMAGTVSQAMRHLDAEILSELSKYVATSHLQRHLYEATIEDAVGDNEIGIDQIQEELRVKVGALFSLIAACQLKPVLTN